MRRIDISRTCDYTTQYRIKTVSFVLDEIDTHHILVSEKFFQAGRNHVKGCKDLFALIEGTTRKEY